MSQYVTPSNNLSPLPFFGCDEHGNVLNRDKWYAYGKTYPIYMIGNTLIPFQFKVDHIIEDYDITFELVDAATGEAAVDFSHSDVILRKKEYSNYTIFYCEEQIIRNEGFPVNVDTGCYYLNVYNTEFHYKSAIITSVKQNIHETFLKLTWWDTANIECEAGAIVYENGYKNTLRVGGEIGYPSYQVEEEGEERDGLFYPTKQISKKVYQLKMILPEELCDALRIARISDFVRIADTHRIFNTRNFDMSVNWLEQGWLAEVTCEFEIETIVKNIGKALAVNSLEPSADNDYASNI